MNYRAVLVDAFGTIVRIRSATHPYRRLLKEGLRAGRVPRPGDVRTLMTFDGDLAQAAELLQITVLPERVAQIQDALDRELHSIEAFPDALEAIQALQAQQVLVGVCSNLATPYGDALKRLFPTLDAYAFSYQIGALKPDPVIYRSACNMLGVTIVDRFGDERVAMVGDSLRCDCHGPRANGINGLHLDRSGAGSITNMMDFASLILAD
ncbi:HAD family hydrolase [Pseudomonas cannabina]|uniref:HAD family hydrolase n=1 Tax=Pseudomonas syringae group TaxID=136849 RepID=UPI0006B8F120|nr:MULTISPECIES: HAD family hydrolase [Pseudomonas syringae group]MCH5531329.1 HAD family hydrolase [Pseudomonas syringae pv. syringae]MCH5541390.1 HAD family hydrolase [Pseudomonas syringae pv. syringae]MCH5546404.1 HAD family hydrolase [Pseudomonas syringae pv. syringae]MCH5604765.1 HAD family hydrolase [Pseudomonas syringae pv. syringae]MCH5609651.1 HAD family hydrolase [Pseudomonas syringae pv. syringae]